MHKKEHISVLKKEAVNYLITLKEGVYVDGTLGLGGHSEIILQKLSVKGKLIGLDWDQTNLDFAKERLKDFKHRFTAIHANFSSLKALLHKLKIKKINGLLLDLGLSSPHVDEGERGFSFLFDAPLDMRFDLTGDTTAADLLNTLDKQELTDIFRKYGEEEKAWRIAGEILESRVIKPFKTTFDLKDAVSRIYGKEKIKGKSVATKVFQAMRIAVNKEMEELETILDQIPDLLLSGGRFVCISYHSLEDRMVKHKMRDLTKDIYSDDPLPKIEKKALLKIVTKKPILPSEDEVSSNPRSRSAKMRVYEKC